jgi:glycosyltransferase involved in cell wall biosynthesis
MIGSTSLFQKFYFRYLAGRIQKVEKQFINEIDALVPISLTDLKWFKVNGLAKPSMVCVPGVNIESLSPLMDAGSGKVFFIGALDWRPNITGLIWFIRNVWPLVLDKVPDATFSIAGRNASKKTIRKVQGKNIIFYGEVTSSFEFIKDKSIMAVPLFSGSGIRMKIIEGMSLGKSIVTTYAGAKGLDYEDKRNIFIADTSVAFTNIILDLLKDDRLRIETGRKAIENVRKNYNILASTENLLKFYSELTV